MDIVDQMKPKFIEQGKANGHDPKALAKQKKELDNKYRSEIESRDKQIAELKKVNNSEATK